MNYLKNASEKQFQEVALQKMKEEIPNYGKYRRLRQLFQAVALQKMKEEMPNYRKYRRLQQRCQEVALQIRDVNRPAKKSICRTI